MKRCAVALLLAAAMCAWTAPAGAGVRPDQQPWAPPRASDRADGPPPADGPDAPTSGGSSAAPR